MKIAPVVSALVLMLAHTAGAATFVNLTAKRMRRAAHFIVVGTVTDLRPVETATGFIQTYATVEVEGRLRGRPGRRLVLRQPGGRIGRKIVSLVGAPILELGERYTLYVVRQRDGSLTLANLGAGTIAHTGRERIRPNFTLIRPDVPARWFRSLVTFSMDRGDVDLGYAGSVAALDDALRAWSAVANLSLVRGADTVVPATESVMCDGISEVLFADPFDDLPDPTNCAGVVAIGGYCGSAESGTVNGVDFIGISKSFVIVNDGYGACPWWTETSVSEMLTHELGHAIGLGHSADPTATMFPFMHLDGRGAGLAPDDVDGARFLYPFGDPTTTASSSTSRTTTSSSSTSSTSSSSSSTSSTSTTSKTSSSSTSSTSTSSSSSSTSSTSTTSETSSSSTSSTSTSSSTTSSTSATLPAAVSATIEADVHTDSSEPTMSFGTRTFLRVDRRPASHVFLRFRVAGTEGRPHAASLHLRAPDVDHASSGGIVQVHAVDCDWDEALTWSTQPVLDPVILASAPGVRRNETMEVDVTAAQIDHDGLYCFGIDTRFSDNQDFVSREGGVAPALLLRREP